MKPKLIILSDLWGIDKSGWITYYTQKLESKYNIHFYDCCDLGHVDKTEYTEDSLHTQFVTDGVELAVRTLLELERDPINILAFSIGGAIAWKAGLMGLKINSLYAVSSTRLRYETETPNFNIHLYFGEKDDNKPNFDWHSKMSVDVRIFKNKTHTFYTETDYIDEVCQDIMCNFD